MPICLLPQLSLGTHCNLTTEGRIKLSRPYTTQTYPPFSNAASSKLGIFFNQILQPKSSLHCLLPPPRDKSLIAKLRVPRKYAVLASRTKKISIIYQLRSSPLSVNLFMFSCCTLRLMHCCFYVLST